MGQFMPMRIFGASLALLGAVLMGIKYALKLSAHISALNSLIEALEIFTAELEARAESLPRIIYHMSMHSKGEAASFFSRLDKSMDKLGREEFSALWSVAAEESLLSLGDELSDFSRLGAIMGRAELETQLKALRSCSQLLRQRLCALQLDYPQKRRLGLALSAGAGLMLIIVLI